MSLLDRFEAWYQMRPSWIRTPLAAAAVAVAVSLFFAAADLLNTLQPPATPVAMRLRSLPWLALQAALGGVTYALLWPRLSSRGPGARLAVGFLTMVAALLPSYAFLLAHRAWDALAASWFWAVEVGVLTFGALAIGRPWRRHPSALPNRLRTVSEPRPPSAQDYGL